MHDITEILLKVALNNINQTINPYVTVIGRAWGICRKYQS
jgi:hypothetical protein